MWDIVQCFGGWGGCEAVRSAAWPAPAPRRVAGGEKARGLLPSGASPGTCAPREAGAAPEREEASAASGCGCWPEVVAPPAACACACGASPRPEVGAALELFVGMLARARRLMRPVG